METQKRFGFMMEQIEVPDDFDTMDSMAIETLFDLAVEQVTPIHKDPFDRLLVAQAQSESIILLTADSLVAQYGDMVKLV
jgi:PIN domain nuclease of toxin-antitoxin system